MGVCEQVPRIDAIFCFCHYLLRLGSGAKLFLFANPYGYFELKMYGAVSAYKADIYL